MQDSSKLGTILFVPGESKNKAEYYLLLVIYRIMLDYCYSKIIYPIYAYSGFEYNRNAILYILSWILLIVSARVVLSTYTNKENKISFEVVFLLYLMSFVPFLSMMAFGAFRNEFILANVLYWLLLMFFTLHKRFIRRENVYRFATGNIALGDIQLIMIALFLGLVTIYISGRYAHFRMNFNLLGVYELRAEASSNNLPIILQYLFSWGRTIIAILIAFFIRKRNIKWAIFCGLVELLSFGYDGSKSTFFLLILAVGINFLPYMDMAKMNKWILRGFVLLVFGCNLFYIVTGNFIPASIMIRRVLFLPVRIAKDYFAFFSVNQPDYLRQSFLRYFGLKSNYEEIPYMIARVYFNAPSMSANNGLISDAMANFGYLGIVIYPIIISMVFKGLDKSANGLDPRIYVIVAIYISLVMTNSFFTTILLTHGLLVAIIMLSMMKREKEMSTEVILAREI